MSELPLSIGTMHFTGIGGIGMGGISAQIRLSVWRGARWALPTARDSKGAKLRTVQGRDSGTQSAPQGGTPFIQKTHSKKGTRNLSTFNHTLPRDRLVHAHELSLVLTRAR